MDEQRLEEILTFYALKLLEAVDELRRENELLRAEGEVNAITDERCGKCHDVATHKVEEVLPDSDITGLGAQLRHPFTMYLCCECFGRLMGAKASHWCGNGHSPQ